LFILNYSVSESTSERDIIAFAKQIIASKFERGTAITSPKASIDFLSSQIGYYEHEVFAALFLDSKHRIIKFEELFTGTIDQASVHTREVVKRALHHNAAAVIFACMDVGKGREPGAEALHISIRQASQTQPVQTMCRMHKCRDRYGYR